MKTSTKNSRLRWIVPVAVAAVLVGGTATVNAVNAAAGNDALPPRTAAELLADVQQAQLGAMSGTVVQTSDLGIPSLPGVGGSSSSDLTALVSGTHTLRVWYDGTDKARLALQGTLGESDVIKNGPDVWTWSSEDKSATHRTISAGDAAAAQSEGGIDPTNLPQVPLDAANQLLKAIDPSTLVTTDGTQTVAGRPVYQLNLSPRDAAGSLISRVSIAIDAEQRIPLRVQVYAVGRPTPAFEVAFTAVDFNAPDAEQFTFNPPPGAEVTEIAPGTLAIPAAPEAPAAASTGELAGLEPTIVGSGWTSVAVVSTGDVSSDPELAGVLNLLTPVSGAWGSGHLFSGTLFSAVVSDDGRIAIGAVQPDLLYAALAR